MPAILRRCLLTLPAFLLLLAANLAAEDGFERPPIKYSKRTPDNLVATLQKKLAAGEVKLNFEEGKGYLPALLDALKVPRESQTLVFSKTSLQRSRIAPRTPRALYFNDDVYVGFCQSGEVLEISAADPELGTVFYTLVQEEAVVPNISRQTDSCLTCHSSSRTDGIPGHLLRSVKVSQSGEPILSAGGSTIDYRTPIKNRWGGWYVTGTVGDQKHLGNLVSRSVRDFPTDDSEGESPVTIADKVNLDRYVTATSDVVALMVLEHQTLMHNRLTKANFETRIARNYQIEMNRALGEPESTPLDSVARRIQSAADEVVDALLFVEEAKLDAPLRGDSGFAERFTAQGPTDSQGRSLREFDLERRIFRYPCSYLIYSKSFDALPEETRQLIWKRMAAILRGDDKSERFAHLTSDDRAAIAAILKETKTGLPADWP